MPLWKCRSDQRQGSGARDSFKGQAGRLCAGGSEAAIADGTFVSRDCAGGSMPEV